MKKNNSIWISQLLILVMLSATTNNCKKDDFVVKKDVTITWANPENIIFGTLLSATQLNATAEGTFIYTPVIGTKLDVGSNQDLKVDFTPTDANVYNSASKTVKINVTDTSSTVFDADGNVYKIVNIGTQAWMVENLRTTKYNDNTAIPNVIYDNAWEAMTTPAYCWNNNDAATNKAAYGALYNWYTVNTGKLAPKGWHVATDAEWTTLENYLIANGFNYDGTTTGNKIAKALGSATGWHSDTGEGTVGNTDYPAKRNATGFTALPGGFRLNDGAFSPIGHDGLWWSSSESGATTAGIRYVDFLASSLNRGGSYKSKGLSVRCLRDF
jgi:uncharacterized protein (TIGR02145 family)